MTERTFDRVSQFDPASRSFGIAAVLPTKPPRSYTWRGTTVLDQGSEGACVGFGWSGELIARPVVVPNIDNPYALGVYHDAQKVDETPGENYSGTSVLAGAKVIATRGYMKEYRWGFSLDDLILALGYAGPVVLGLNWYTGMMDTDASGLIHVSGKVEGGHCVVSTGVNVKHREISGPNSWGSSWGKAGYWRISFDDIDRLLHEQGEQCIPVGRRQI